MKMWFPNKTQADLHMALTKLTPHFQFLILCISMGAALTSSLVFLAGRATAEELLGPQKVPEKVIVFIAVGIKQPASLEKVTSRCKQCILKLAVISL